MKNIQLITRQITLWALLTAGLFLNTSGQVYQPGDLYTFEDGSKGIVFYVNPDNPGSGTVAALHDLGEQYALWNGNKPSVMKNSTLHRYDFDYSGNISWSHEGKLFTQLLKASGASPLTDTIGAEIDNGWYIPDVVQLRCLLAMAPYLEEYFAAQQGEVFNMWNRNYWSSCFSPYEENKVYYVDKIRFNITDGSNAKYIRLVRDFPDSSVVHAFWKEFPPLSETKVSPDSTRDYDALVILRSDTIRLSGSVTVHHPVQDTIIYATSSSQLSDGEFIAACHTFTGITASGSYTARDTLTAANGCDSIVVVELIVTEDAHYYDTICPQVEQYAFAPFDTVFLSGTVSGEYIHHGSKVIDGHTVDTTAYLHLTVLPVYDTPDTVSWCLYGDAETMSYPNDPHVTLTSETNDGTVTISATSSTSAITIEEGTSTGDFLLRMTTVHGCDSIVRLHVRTTAVARDTLYYDVSASHVTEGEITTACHTFTGITAPGSYTTRDTLTAANGCDSIVVVTLIVTEDAHYYDTICPQVEQYAFAPFDTVFLSGTVSGEYIHHGSKVIDGHTVDTTAYLHLTVLPVYDNPDTVSWCLYGESETMPYPNDPRVTLSAESTGGTVTISATSSTSAITIEEGTSTGDFLLRMTTVHGCDSIVRLHVRTTAVAHDTTYSHVSVQQVQDNRVTVDNYTFENVTAPGSYTARDTLTAANGCDSIVVVTLIVTEDAHYYDTICPQVEQYVFAPFDTVFLSGTVSGEYVHHGSKLIDGHTVDTTAYLHLTVLPVYDTPDTVSWCLYGESETMPYPNDPRVTLSAESTGGTVTISATSSTSAITIEEGTSTGDFLLRMTTVHGCDSIVRLHVRTTAVARDTLYYDVSASHVTEGEITTACHTFTGITTPGSYTVRDTLTAANGCDSIVVVTLIVTEDAHYYDTICPQVDHYAFAPFDTVFLSGTVSGEYIHHGSKVIDGHTVDTTAYLHLTVLPVYDIPDTVSWCLYGESETMPYPNDPRVTLSAESTGGTVTISATSSTSAITIEEGTSTGDFLLRMTTVHGCDSIVRLHVRTTAVARDTLYSHVSVQQVQDNRVTVDNYTFENVTAPGSYTTRDTLTAANGCDSIVIVTLIVTEDAHYYDTICPQVEQYAFAPFDTVFLSGTASGEYIHHGSKVIDGHTVDTTAYLHLTVLPVYDIPDTVSWCLYGESETMPYPNEPRVTLSAETNDGTVTISATSSTSAITIEEGTAVGDFLLHMTTVHGCDSIVRLHVRTTAVAHDTTYSHVSVQQVQDNRVTVDNYTFENVNGLGSYTTRDTLTAANGCDSIVVVTLIVTEDAHYYDTICPQVEQYAFAPFDTVFLSGTASGEYIHHGSKVIDGHTVDTTAYLHLTVLPVYDIPDTVSWCLYGESETMPYPNEPRVTLSAETNDGTVTISATSSTSAITIEEGTAVGDFLLHMTTVHGCDSIVRLHVRTTAVAHDTTYSHVSVQQVQDNRVTVDNYTFENVNGLGSYTTRDTLTAANGCDSIVVVTLIVTEDAHYYDTICPQVDHYTFAPFDTVFLSGTVSGEYVHHGSKVIDGHAVDTTAFLQLTVLPVYDIPDTVSWCLYGNSETIPYEHDPRITLSAETNDGNVTISATSSNTAITIEEGTAVGDFLLRMTTVHGCDSIVRLHVRTTAVARDTMYSHISVQQVQDNRVTVDNHTFENVTGLGSYTARDTLTAANGCDSIVVVELIVNGCSVDFTISCPPDIYDTLAFGDCAMTIYPEEIGTPTIQCDQEWPFFIRNDMPESSVFPQGDNIITWIATDSICGFSDTCEQHVFIAYPQCPDAIDCEGNIYAGIRIGCDCWTQRNLESTKYSDCTDIPDVMGYASLLHPDTANNIAIFGRLYTFEAAVHDSADNGHGHIQGICPEGWYLPTPEKYESLNEYGTEALRSPLYWIIGAGNNSTGFSALPAGYYNGEKSRYEGLLSETYFWSSQGVGTHTMRTPSFIAYYCDQVLLQDLNGGLGYSVRCIKERE